MHGATTFVGKDFRRETCFAITVTERTGENKKAAEGSRKRKEKRWGGMQIRKNCFKDIKLPNELINHASPKTP